MAKKKGEDLPFYIHLVTGGVAGVFGTCCVFPIDVAKTRLQKQKAPFPGGPLPYRGMIHTLTTVARTQGIRTLYKGIAPNLIGVFPEKALKLSINEGMRKMLTDKSGNISFVSQAVSGATAGFCQVICTNPMELVKIRMQVEAQQSQNPRPLRAVVQELGLKGMYKGTAATLLRDVPFSVVFFTSFAMSKEKLADEHGETSIARVLLAGTIAGVLAGASSTPADVIKTRLQIKAEDAGVEYKGIVDAFTKIRQEEGMSAFMKGAGPRCMIIAPLFGISLMTFEFINRKLG